MKRWILAARPKTLPAAAAPVAIASSMACHAGKFHPFVAGACLLFGLLVQIATNFANDYFDYKKGADTEERLGPTRVCQAGLVSETEMQRACFILFFLVACVGLGLSSIGGFAMCVVTVFSLVCAYTYTGGPYPLGYNGLGDAFVVLFFGPVAVGTTYYLQVGRLPLEVLLMGLCPGLISMGIIAVNNLRDAECDKKAGKKTLAVVFGTAFAKAEYGVALVLALLLPAVYKHFLPLLGFVFAVPLIGRVYRDSGTNLNYLLADTGKFLMAFSVLFFASMCCGI